MAKEGRKDVKVEEDAAKTKYTFSEIYDYVVHKTYPSHADKLYKELVSECQLPKCQLPKMSTPKMSTPKMSTFIGSIYRYI